jgi:hypothetical protein
MEIAMSDDEFYNPIDDAPVATFAPEGGDIYEGAIAQHEWVSDKFNADAQVMAITLKLDKPLGGDCPYVKVMVRSDNMRRAIGRAYTAAGRTALVDGDWLSVECTGEEQSQSGTAYKTYVAKYLAADDPEPALGGGEFVEDGAYRPSLFASEPTDAPPF